MVFHLAAAVGVRLIVESPVNTIETNVHGTEMVLKLANKKKKKVLLASTSEVYGKSNVVPFREDGDLVLGPDHARAAGATPAARRSTSSWPSPTTRRSACRWWSSRLFNTVGPRQTGRYGMVIPNFVKQALLGHPITVFGDGTPEPLLHLRERRGGRSSWRSPRTPAAVGQVFNIGNDREEVTILELARRVKERTGATSEIVLVPYDQAYEEGFEDMQRRVPDLAQAARRSSATSRRSTSTRSSTASIAYFTSDATRL